MSICPNKALRRKIISMVSDAGASHVGASLSAVELLKSVFSIADIEKIKQKSPDRDRVILSKGHAAAALYVVMNHFGLISEQTLGTYCKNGSVLAGHASHFAPYVEHSTGALGHGLAVAAGVAAGLRSHGSNGRVFVIVGDGELNEGSNWEALMFAGHHLLNNLCVIVDANGLDQMGRVEDICRLSPLADKLESFGFEVRDLDGHDEEKLTSELLRLGEYKKPLAIIAQTVKGKGVSFMENNVVWHYRPPKGDDVLRALAELQ